MVAIGGYEITEELYRGPRTLVWRARDAESRPVVLKLLNRPHPTPEEVARFHLECEIMRSLVSDGVVRALGTTEYQRSPVLVLEDFGALSLAEWLRAHTPLDARSFLRIAVAVADALDHIHRQGIIHKDINPANILIQPETMTAKITDFGIASQLAREDLSVLDPAVLEGTLPYLSPEQTGRMNRSLDYRSDFYSLGVTFYQMLTGRLPFEADDPMELVHNHLAKYPVPPGEVRPGVSPALSRIVMKLLAKNAEDRYQSASGLKADLEECARQIEAGGAIDDFVLAQRDLSYRFQVPQKLYGRQADVQTLLDAFERARGGENAFVLVAGYSGIGKSALVREVHKPIVRERGYFLAGKFDQFQRNRPYSALLQAFRELIRQILSEPEAQIQAWKRRLLDALQANGQVLVDVLGELELVIGKQPPVPALDPRETRNRFNHVFRSFLNAVAEEQALVVFLDDLQWADAATLHLVETMAAPRTGGQRLLLIGAYRDNEVDAAHPLMLLVDALRKAGAPPTTLTLAPLGPEHVHDLVADTLHCGHAQAAPLAQIVYAKTRGNPFFVGQLLRSLHEAGLIRLDPAAGHWTFDEDGIRQVEITDNVVDLMIGKLRSLPESTQNVLKLAACIGNGFDLHTLSVVHKKSIHQTSLDLWQAVQEELVLPASASSRRVVPSGSHAAPDGDADGMTYRFLHDRVQQAAYSLIPEPDRPALHLTVGRLMRESLDEATREERAFDLLGQFNRGASLVTDPEERAWLARLNLVAGRKAKASTAYIPALEYLTTGCALQGEGVWRDRYDLALELHIERADCAHLSGDEEQAETFYGVALANARDKADRARVYEKKIHFYTNLGDFGAAYETARSALRLFGVSLPTPRSAKPLLIAEFVRAKAGLRKKRTADLLQAPDMADEDLRTSVRLIAVVLKAAYQIQPELCVANAIKIVNLTLRHGNMEDNAIGFMVFGGIFLGGVLGDHQSAYDIGNLALSLIEKYDNIKLRSEVNFVYGYFANSWTKPARDTEQFFRIAYQAGTESGDFFHASCASCASVQSLFMRGAPLDEVEREARRYLLFVERVENRDATGAIQAVLRVVRNLQGRTPDPLTFSGEGGAPDEAQFVETLRAFGSQHFAHFFFVDKMQALYLWGETERALEAARVSEMFLADSIGMLHMAEHHFYHSLICAALYPDAPRPEQVRHRHVLERGRKRFQKWAARCPANFQDRHLLLSAELARISTPWKAAELYEGAVEAARASGHLQIEALANERAARHYLATGAEMAAHPYLVEARHGYARWGATAKVQALEREFPYLAVGASSAGNGLSADVTVTRTATAESGTRTLDLGTAMKASQALSAEIVLENLLKRLMTLVIENAGAHKGFLILESGGQMRIEAEGAVDKEEVVVLQSLPVFESDELSAAIVQYVARTRETVVLGNAAEEGLFTADPYIAARAPKSVLCAPLLNQGNLIGILYLENDRAANAFTPDRLELLNLLCAQAAISIQNARLYSDLARTNLAYSRFVPREFLSFLNRENIIDVQLGDQVQQVMTVLFTDIRSFTTLSEAMTPKENFEFLNSFLRVMGPVIRAHGGFIDKYIGDTIMALFPECADAAVRAAIALRGKLDAFNRAREERGEPRIEMGVGIHTGTLMLGTIGEEERMEGTVISDAVNLASRIEGLTKRYRVPVLISGVGFDTVVDPARYQHRLIDRVRVHGRAEDIAIIEILDGQTPAARENKRETAAHFARGLEHYRRREFAEARACFSAVLAKDPEDGVAALYVERSARCLAEGVPADWEPIETLDTK